MFTYIKKMDEVVVMMMNEPYKIQIYRLKFYSVKQPHQYMHPRCCYNTRHFAIS
jgi:hypothetical protein